MLASVWYQGSGGGGVLERGSGIPGAVPRSGRWTRQGKWGGVGCFGALFLAVGFNGVRVVPSVGPPVGVGPQAGRHSRLPRLGGLPRISCEGQWAVHKRCFMVIGRGVMRGGVGQR